MADVRNDSDSYSFIAHSSIFLNSLLTKDKMDKNLFENTKNPILDAVTHKCVEL